MAVVLKNEAALLELFLAATQAGMYLTPINANLAAPEIAYILQDSDAKAFVVSDKAADVCEKAATSIGFPEKARFTTGTIPGFRPYSELSAGQPDTLPERRSAGAAMTYTSGTTGRPKGVRRAMGDVAPEVVAQMRGMFLHLFGIPVGGDGVHLVVSPLYHTAVLSFATDHLHLGHTVVLMDKWTPEGMLEKIEKYKVTSSHMVPTQFRRLLSLPEAEKTKRDLSSLRHMIHSAAPCPVDVKQAMLAWWGPCIYEYYAASEGGGTLATPQDWLKHPGTVGNPWPISKIKVVKDDGTDCAVREVGTVYISMGQHKFEYHKDQKKTESSWQGEFFTVGDAGYLDEDGFLFLCDRKADMIISGGVNIYPAEIEAIINAHPDVHDVAVFGIPDEDWGEQVKAVVEPNPGVTPGPDLEKSILAFCAEKLAKFKTPKSIDFTDAMPRDPNGKLYKRKLRDPFWEGKSRNI